MAVCKSHTPSSTRLASLAFILTVALGAACQTATKTNYVATGNQYAKDGLLREAAEAYKKALAQKSNNITAHRNLGMVLVKTGDYKAATRHLEKSMQRYEADFDANLYLAEAYRAQDQYAESIFRYKRALKIKPDDARAMKPLAWSYFKIRYYSEALQIARDLQKVAPQDEQTGIILSRTLLKLKRPKEALTVMRAAKAKAPKSAAPYYNSVEGDILYELNDTASAAKAYKEALKDQPLLAGALLGLGRCMLEDGKTKAAISYMERAVRVRPRLTEAHYLLGKAYESSDRDKALRYYQYFKKQASADPEYITHLNDVKQRITALQANAAPINNTKSTQ